MQENFATVMEQIRGGVDEVSVSLANSFANLRASDINFSLFGLNLGDTPNWRVWETGFAWTAVGLFMLPLLSVGLSLLSMFITQKLNANDQQAKQMRGMMLIGPVFSLWIGFSMPGLMSIYWVSSSFISIIRDVALTRHYRGVVDAEFAEKDAELAARTAELEAKRIETERLKLEGEIKDNPNTSRKKREQQEKREREQRTREWEETQGIRAGASDASQVGDRMYARGRNYKPDRYARGGVEVTISEEETNETA